MNPERFFVFKALGIGPQMNQFNTSPTWTIHGCNLEQLLVFKALWVGWRGHQSTSRTPPTHGRSRYVIQNNSLFLGLYELVNECTNPPVEHLPRVDNPCMKSKTTSCFWGSSESVDKTLPSSNVCMTHICNPEQLLVFRALPSLSKRLFQVSTRGWSTQKLK